MNDYIEANLITLKAEIDALPRELKAEWDRLNELFMAVVG